MSAPDTNYAAWLAKAESDFLNIKNNLSAPLIPWDTVCFHSQQAAEKTPKAFLVFHHRPLARTHDLVALLARCVEIEPSLAGLEEDCRRLTFFAVASRYPDDLYEPTEKEGRAMVAAARRVHEQIVSWLPP
jgi:HEPN domain-containing protein